MAEVETRGTGQAERIADRAVLHVAYTEGARNRAAAVDALTKRIRVVESALERDGVEVRDRRLFVHDRWDVNGRSGAQANQSYQLRITDLAVLDDLIADLVQAQPASLRGPLWELADQAAAVGVAQHEAVVDARRRAEGYAEALGARLGPLVRIKDEAAGPHAVALGNMKSALERSPSPDISALSLAPQSVTIAITCTTVWELLG